MGTKPTELRRSKRISHKIKKCDRFYSDLSDTVRTYDGTESMYHRAKDELTGRGCISHIEDIKVIEFETLEDMKFYDKAAEKIGNVCCASFNELYLPFRGFSEEECDRSRAHLFQFESWSKSDALDVDQGSKKSKSKLKRENCIKFDESTICEPHGEKSFVSCSADAKSHNLKLSDVGGLLTPSFPPNTSFNNVTVSSIELADSEFEENIEEDLLLTPQGSPATSEQDPLCPNPTETMPIDLSAIPYIFKCSASHECLSSKACADMTSHFTLCIHLTPGKGRALSKLAIKYLDYRQESNIVDRASAMIAASAVEASASTVFLPLSKDFISCAFPKSNLIHYLESPSSVPHMKVVTLSGSPKHSDKLEKLFECSNLEKTPCELQNTIFPLLTEKSDGSSKSTDTIKQMKRKLNGSTPGLQMKKPLIDSSASSDGQQFHEMRSGSVIVTDSFSNKLLKETDQMNPSRIPEPVPSVSMSKLPLLDDSLARTGGNIEKASDSTANSDGQQFHDLRSGSVIVTDSFSNKSSNETDQTNPSRIPEPVPSVSMSKLPLLDDSLGRTGGNIEKASDSTANSDGQQFHDLRSGSVIVTDSFSNKLLKEADQMNPSRIPEPVPSVSMSKLPLLDDSLAKTGGNSEKTSDSTSSSTQVFQPNSKKHGSLSSCPIHGNKKKAVVTEVQAGHSRSVIDLTSENDTPRYQAGTAQNHSRATKRKMLSSSDQLPERVIVIDDNSHEAVVTEVQAGHSRSVIDLTNENDTPRYQAGTAQNCARATKRKTLSSSIDQLPEKVIVIDDNAHETGNQLEFTSGTPNIESGSRLQKLDSTIHHHSFSRSPISEDCEVSNPPVHSQKLNRNLDSNQKVIDLTECSGVDDTQNCSQSGLAKRPRSNSKEKVIDLTNGDAVQSPLNIEKITTSEQSDVVSNKDGVSNHLSLSKSYKVPNREEVIEDYSVKPRSGLQELAVMCTNVPSLGFIRVIRCSSGELMLNETFTARVYKHFEDLKALNSYLNLRFEKMPGVKDQSPLKWILATAGVINIKKVRPINPKVWFHPNDYILTEDGPASVRLAVPSNLSKKKSSLNKTKSSLSNSPTVLKSKLVQITQTETKSTLLPCSKSLGEKDRLIPVTTSNSPSSTNLPVISDKQPRTARLVSLILNKNDRQQLGFISNKIKHTKHSKPSQAPSSITKPIHEKSCHPLNKQLYSLPKYNGNMSSVDINETSRNMLPTVPSSNTDLDITVPQPVASLPRSGTQSTGSVSSSSSPSMTSKSSSSQNVRVVIVSAANPSIKPNTITPNTYVSNPQPAVIKNKKHCQTNKISPADRVQKIMDCKPNAPQITKRLLFNNDPTSIPIVAQPPLQSKVHSSAAIKSSMGQTVVLLPNKNPSQSINQVPLLQTSLVTNQFRDNLPGSNLVQVGTSQNLKLIIESLKAQGCKINQYQLSSRSNTVQSVSLPKNFVVQPTSQESSNIPRSTLEKSITEPVSVLVDSRLNQAVNNHQYKVTPSIQQTSNATKSMAILSTKEPPPSSILVPPKKKTSSIVQTTQPMVVWASIPSGQTKDIRKLLPMPKPLMDGQKCMSINDNRLPCGNFAAKSTNSVSQVPGRSPPQPTNLDKLNTIRPLSLANNSRIQAGLQISCRNVPGVVINKSITPQRTIIVSTSQNMNPPLKIIPVMSSNAQGSTIGKVNAAQSVTLSNQHINQTGTTEETLYPDAMIYFPTEAKYVKGIPVQKCVPDDPSKMNSGCIIKHRPEKSSGANVPTTKPVESCPPKVVYS